MPSYGSPSPKPSWGFIRSRSLPQAGRRASAHPDPTWRVARRAATNQRLIGRKEKLARTAPTGGQFLTPIFNLAALHRDNRPLCKTLDTNSRSLSGLAHLYLPVNQVTLPPGHLVEVTSRTNHGRLLLAPGSLDLRSASHGEPGEGEQRSSIMGSPWTKPAAVRTSVQEMLPAATRKSILSLGRAHAAAAKVGQSPTLSQLRAVGLCASTARTRQWRGPDLAASC